MVNFVDNISRRFRTAGASCGLHFFDVHLPRNNCTPRVDAEISDWIFIQSDIPAATRFAFLLSSLPDPLFRDAVEASTISRAHSCFAVTVCTTACPLATERSNGCPQHRQESSVFGSWVGGWINYISTLPTTTTMNFRTAGASCPFFPPAKSIRRTNPLPCSLRHHLGGWRPDLQPPIWWRRERFVLLSSICPSSMTLLLVYSYN